MNNADSEFMYASERFLLLLIYDLLNDEQRGGVQRNEITDLHDDPGEFEVIYQKMLIGFEPDHNDGFGNMLIEVNSVKKECSQQFCFYGESPKNPLRICFLGMCIAIANCLWYYKDTDFEQYVQYFPFF